MFFVVEHKLSDFADGDKLYGIARDSIDDEFVFETILDRGLVYFFYELSKNVFEISQILRLAIARHLLCKGGRSPKQLSKNSEKPHQRSSPLEKGDSGGLNFRRKNNFSNLT